MYGLKIFGFVFGFIGVGVISLSSLIGYIFVIGIFFVLGCVIGWVFGIVFIKKIGYCVNVIWMVII